MLYKSNHNIVDRQIPCQLNGGATYYIIYLTLIHTYIYIYIYICIYVLKLDK